MSHLETTMVTLPDFFLLLLQLLLLLLQVCALCHHHLITTTTRLGVDSVSLMSFLNPKRTRFPLHLFCA